MQKIISTPTISAKTFSIFISAGEASGDLHASNLVKQITASHPNIKFSGMGGALMRSAGVKIIVDSTSLAVIGGIEILFHAKKIFAAMRTVKRELTLNRPDLLILIDYPGFNLWLAKTAKKLGIKVLYYISPQIWAWRQNRVKKIRRYVDLMAVIFPFEVKFYADANVPVVLVRHPLLDIVKPSVEKNAAKALFGLNQNATTITIGLFPGSRHNEIKRLLPVMLETAKLLEEKHPNNIQFVLPLASSLYNEENSLRDIILKLAPQLTITFIKNQTYDAANVCDAIIAASGTVTLEIALLGIPMVIVYQLTNLTYWIIKQIIKIPYIGLCNIVAEKRIVQEFIQHKATPQNISQEVEKILNDANYRNNMVNELNHIKQKLKANDNMKNIKDVALEMLSFF